jgi:hypothetical protein
MCCRIYRVSILLIGLLALPRFGFAEAVAGADWDAPAGVDWYVANAWAVLRVQAQTEAEAKTFPPPNGQQRLLVREVVKGFAAAQQVLQPAGAINPGQHAVVLVQYEHLLANKVEAVPKFRFVWRLEADRLLTGDVPADSDGLTPDKPVMLKDVRAMVASSSPEEVELYPQVIDAIFFPEKMDALARKDPDRAVYVRFAAVVRDLDRDVPSLALLLEANDAVLRAAAEKKLLTLTEADVARPADETPASRHVWSEDWRRWWTDHKDALVWDETKSRWAAATKGRASPSRWPDVPVSLKSPVDGFPSDLLQSIEKKDTPSFGRAFRAWIDGGVLRDRQIGYAMNLSRDLVYDSQLGGAIGQSDPYLPPASRLRAEVLINDKLSGDKRMKAVALFASLWHWDRFVAERARALKQLETAPAVSDVVERAAFWEPRRSMLGNEAERLLGKSNSAASGKLLLHLFMEDVSDAILDGARTRIQSRDKRFIGDLVEYVKKDRGSTAQWAGRLLCQEHQSAVVPLQLEWLKDGSAEVRASAAFNLCWLASEDAIPGLLEALKVEKVPRVREELLRAIGQTGDKRGLDVLLTAAADDKDKTTLCEVARGLARIGDKRALPALAELASRDNWEAINSFGYVSGLYKGYAPDRFWSYPGRSEVEMAAGRAVIEKWRAEQKKAK